MGDGRILHAAAVRIRVTGSGDLQLALTGYDEVLTKELVAMPMKPVTAYEQTRLCNYKSPEIRVKVSTNKKGEQFRINRITVFVKPLWQEYPT